jgi:large subunit ribosomal protein L9
MKVILLEDVVGAGSAGDVVEVKNGYARNKLIPAGMAIEANAANMKTLEHRRVKIAAKKTADKETAQTLCVKIDGKEIDFVAKAGDSGKLFGSITAHDITEALNDLLGFELDRRKLLLDAPLKEVGIHDVRYRVYPEVEATIKVNILAEGGQKKHDAETPALTEEETRILEAHAEEAAIEMAEIEANIEEAENEIESEEAIEEEEYKGT